jgi:peptidoglycan/xylan/chitin deacetylase (PgdA/CDA1 family)
MRLPTWLLLVTLTLTTPALALALEPIPDKLVVLTFDDSSRSHVTVAAPLLKKHGFGATFFVTEGFDVPRNQRDYMTWDEIAQLHRDGFEIGNHTRDHKPPSVRDPKGTAEQVEAINARCQAHGIPRPVSFAYPGNALDKDVLPILRGLGIKFARRGGAPEYPYDKGRGFAYEPGLDHPLLPAPAGRTTTSSGPSPRPAAARSPSSSSTASPTRRTPGSTRRHPCSSRTSVTSRTTATA